MTKLIIDGNAVYEIDEACLMKQKIKGKNNSKEKENKKKTEKK